jgi:tetratricopeptide (TPR) repeat protein
MQRGMLHAQHEHPDSALADYQVALSNGLDTSLLHLLMAEAFLAKQNTEDGLNSVSAFLKQEPQHLKGIHTRGKLFETAKQFDAAIDDFEFVIAHSKSSRPQDFVALSSLYLKRDSSDLKNAVDVLNRGREKLGNIISLEMQLFKLHKNSSNFDAAHVVLDRMMKPLSRKERLMVEKAELFLFQGEPLKAKETLANAENAIASLPARFQNLGATIKLKERINELKQNL